MQYVLFNPQAGNGSGAQQARALDARFPEETFSYTDMTTISDYAAWLGTLPADASLIIAGGDGTLNRFLNDTNGMALPEQLYYFATGSGNDFLHDLGLEKGADPVPVAQYLRDLPTVTVNGKHWRFLNGIGYGIDGYCCQVGDALRGKSDKPVNYTAIAIKGLLFHFHPANAEVTVDGKTKRYRRVWLAPTMNGRFYGGGMMVTPDQHRGNAEGKVSVCVMHGSGKIKTLAVFPSIFKGGHVKHTEMVEILTGHDIEVRFDSPCALQIDGETIRNVTSYSVHAGVRAGVLHKKTAGVCIPPADGVSKKPRRVRRPQAANQIGSFSPAACTSEKNTAQSASVRIVRQRRTIVRAADCSPFVWKAQRAFQTVNWPERSALRPFYVGFTAS